VQNNVVFMGVSFGVSPQYKKNLFVSKVPTNLLFGSYAAESNLREEKIIQGAPEQLLHFTGPGRNCSSILVLLESCLQTCMTYTIAECTVNKLLMMDRGTVRNM
jgi:hypothetical protein